MFLPLKVKSKYNRLAISSIFFLLRSFIGQSQLNFPEFLFKTTAKSCLDFLYTLKNHSMFKVDFLNDLVVTDHLTTTTNKRFLVSYILTSLSLNTRYRINVWVPEITHLSSLSLLFKNSLWLEREAWDFFGVFFSKHPDLRRILTDYGFKGYPLRKDFPLVGFYEMFYDFKFKKTLYKLNVFCQEYRIFIT